MAKKKKKKSKNKKNIKNKIKPDRKKELDRKIKENKAENPFQMPKDISFKKEQTSFGFVYNFRHKKLGKLGRIVLEENMIGQTHVSIEIAGDPDDPGAAADFATWRGRPQSGGLAAELHGLVRRAHRKRRHSQPGHDLRRRPPVLHDPETGGREVRHQDRLRHGGSLGAVSGPR